jgi:signal peptidase II
MGIELTPVRRGATAAGWIAFGLVAASAVAVDQLTKAIVRARLPLGHEVPAFGPFSIHHVRNSGILGGHFEGTAVPIGVATTIALLALVVYVASRSRPRPVDMVGFGLILGGGVGNLVDRLRLGYVTDFVDRGSAGAFNLADAAIMLGFVVLIAGVLLSPRRQPTPDPRAQAERE